MADNGRPGDAFASPGRHPPGFRLRVTEGLVLEFRTHLRNLLWTWPSLQGWIGFQHTSGPALVRAHQRGTGLHKGDSVPSHVCPTTTPYGAQVLYDWLSKNNAAVGMPTWRLRCDCGDRCVFPEIDLCLRNQVPICQMHLIPRQLSYTPPLCHTASAPLFDIVAYRFAA